MKNEVFIVSYFESRMEDSDITIPLTVCTSLDEVIRSTGSKNIPYVQERYNEVIINNSDGFLIGRGMCSMYLIKIVKLNESAVKLSEKLD